MVSQPFQSRMILPARVIFIIVKQARDHMSCLIDLTVLRQPSWCLDNERTAGQNEHRENNLACDRESPLQVGICK